MGHALCMKKNRAINQMFQRTQKRKNKKSWHIIKDKVLTQQVLQMHVAGVVPAAASSVV